MHAETITLARLKANPALATAVSDRIALVEAPQSAGYPALVCTIVTDTPQERLCSPSRRYVARVQINPFAPDMQAVLTLHALTRAALERFEPLLMAGGVELLLSCVYMGMGPASKDEITGMWTKSADYMLCYAASPTA